MDLFAQPKKKDKKKKIDLFAGSKPSTNTAVVEKPSNFVGSTIKPRGEASLERPNLTNPRKLPNGNVKYDKPSGGTIEFRPDNSFISTLPAHLGGGAYEAKQGGGLIGTAKDRQDKRSQDYLTSASWADRDHIVPVSLGGISSKTNLRQVAKAENPADLETRLADDVASGRKTVQQARVEIMAYKQNAFGSDPKKLNWFEKGVSDISSGIGNLFKSKPKSQGQIFQVGENLSPEQKKQADLTLIRSHFATLADKEGSKAATDMNIKYGVQNVVRAPLRGLISITSPDKKLDPLDTKDPIKGLSPKLVPLFRFVYGDEPVIGYSRKAVDYEDNFKQRGFGVFSTPLAVIAATGEASLDLAPLYTPLLSSVNEELANIARTTGTKQIKFTYKDLQDITTATSDDIARLRVGQEKLDAFKAIGNELDKKNLASNVVTKSEDTFLKQATRPFGEAATETSYSVEGAVKSTPKPTTQLNGTTQNPFETKAVTVTEKPTFNPFKSEATIVKAETPNPFKPSETPKTALQEVKITKPTQVTPKEDSLITEARKYKSVEEFVKNFEFHGSNIKNITKLKVNDGVVSLSPQEEVAKSFGENVYSVNVGNKKILDISQAERTNIGGFKELENLVGHSKNDADSFTKLKELGYDGIRMPYDGKGAIETVFFKDIEALNLDKSQLTDIYNKAHANLAETPKQPTEIAKIEGKKVIEKASETPQTIQETPSKIAKSVAQKAIDKGFTEKLELAGYDKITVEGQKTMARDLFSNPTEALKVLTGEIALPQGLNPVSAIIAAEEYIDATGDIKMLKALGNSELISETSVAAQTMRMAAERTPDSLTAKLQEIKKAREIKTAPRKKAFVKKLKEAVDNSLTKEEAAQKRLLDKFLKDISC